jgi:hypothetical protein
MAAPASFARRLSAMYEAARANAERNGVASESRSAMCSPRLGLALDGAAVVARSTSMLQ